MGILQAQNISLAFGERVILNNVCFTLGERARAALAGGNGEGKSTLMKVVSSIITSDSGKITQTKGMRIAYLPQSDIVLKDNTVYEEIEGAFDRFCQNLNRQHEIESILQNRNDNSLLEELNVLQESLLSSTYYRREAIIYNIAKGLGFKETDLSRPCSQFSGGYQMRIALAKVLAQDPDLMMLDEPTNYLDIEARLWLANYLKTFNGSLFIVCHDKGFLDETVNEVYELFNSKLTRYSGNYSFYEKQRKQEIEQLEAAYKRQEDEIEKTEQFIERFRYKATKAKQVQSRIKALDKIERVVVPSHLKTLKFSFPQPPHSPNDVVVIEGLTKSYGELNVFTDLNLHIAKGQRLAVTGHNGIGKSTLLRIIAGCDHDFIGNVKLGPGVQVGYYSQDTADSLDMEGTVLSQVSSFGSEGQMRNALGSFLFSGDDIFKKATVLSGGERSRLALLKILLQPASLLILDEPTNHLDINSKDMLLNALKEYKGTIVFVSHDSYFIKAIADSILYLSEDKPELYNGDYDYFEWKLSQKLGFETQESAKTDTAKQNEDFLKSFDLPKQPTEDRAAANKRRNAIQKLKREAEALLSKIDELEMKASEVKALMNLHENYSNTEKIQALDKELNQIIQEKEELENTWMEKSEELLSAQ